MTDNAHHSPHSHSHGRGTHSDGHHPREHHRLAFLVAEAPRLKGIHRLDRRRFIADLGRGTLALALLGPMVACSNSSDGSSATTSSTASQSRATDEDGDDVESLQWSQVNLGFVSAYVLVRGNTAAVVDSGTAGSAAAIGEGLATLGVTYDDVSHVLLTHAHDDHIGGLPEVLGEASTATTYAGAADAPKIEVGGAAVTPVGDGDDVFGLQIIETPGHTPGSISMFDSGVGLLIAGDALNTDASGSEITAANPQFTSDMGSADASVKKLAALSPDAVVVGHGNPVTVGAGSLLGDLAATL